MNLYAWVPDSKTAQTAVPVTFSTRARMGTFRKLPSLPSLPSLPPFFSGPAAFTPRAAHTHASSKLRLETQKTQKVAGGA